MLDAILTGEEDTSYSDLLVRLWRRYFTLADWVKALDEAISRSGIQVARQTCLVHLKRRVDRRVRDALDLLPGRPHPGLSPPISWPPGNYGPSSA